MNALDFSPLYRTLIGFDRVFRMLEGAEALGPSPGYPPYNIEQLDEDRYRVVMAVAGFSRDDLSIELKDDMLTVTGKLPEPPEGATFLHRGIPALSFARSFRLADHVEVVDAALADGVLTIDFTRQVPEEEKPRRIEISRGGTGSLFSKAKKLIEGKANAA